MAAIAANNSNSLIVDTTVGSYDMVLYASESGDKILYYFDGSGPHVAIDFVEEPDGTVSTACDGVACVVACDSQGGVVVTMATLGDDPVSVAVDSSGAISSGSPKNACPCIGNGNRIGRAFCTAFACEHQLVCKYWNSEESAWCQYVSVGGGQ